MRPTTTYLLLAIIAAAAAALLLARLIYHPGGATPDTVPQTPSYGYRPSLQPLPSHSQTTETDHRLPSPKTQDLAPEAKNTHRAETETSTQITRHSTSTNNTPMTTQTATTTQKTANRSLWAQIAAELQQKIKAANQTTDSRSSSLVDAVLSGTWQSQTPAPAETLNPSEFFRPDPQTEHAIRTYANALARALQRFKSQHPKQSELLTDFFQDPDTHRAALQTLAEAYRQHAQTLQHINPPAYLKGTHQGIVAGEQHIAEALGELARAPKHQWYEKAIAYNRAADTMARALVRLAEKIRASGVSFAAGEPGGVFLWQPMSGGL